MAMFDFDVADYEAPMDFEIIPEGTEVRLKCTDAEDKETKSGGEMVACTFQVVEGEYKGRKIWTNFNTVNKSAKAQEFGRRMLSGWARACGKPNAKSTDELLDKPFWCKLGIEEGTGGYKDKNVIASFLMPESAVSAPKKSEPTPAKEKTPTPDATGEEETSAPKKEAPKPAASGKKMPWDD